MYSENTENGIRTMYMVCGIIFDDVRTAIQYAEERHEKRIEEIRQCGMRAWKKIIMLGETEKGGEK